MQLETEQMDESKEKKRRIDEGQKEYEQALQTLRLGWRKGSKLGSKAMDLFGTAAQAGSVKAQLWLAADYYREGRCCRREKNQEADKKFGRSLQYFKDAAKGGSLGATSILSQLSSSSLSEVNIEFEILKIMANELNFADSAYEVARYYQNGHTVYKLPPDSKASLKYYRMAAELGHTGAKNTLSDPAAMVDIQLFDPSTLQGWLDHPESYVNWLQQPFLAESNQNTIMAISGSLWRLHLYVNKPIKESLKDYDLDKVGALLILMITQACEALSQVPKENNKEESNEIGAYLTKLLEDRSDIVGYLQENLRGGSGSHSLVSDVISTVMDLERKKAKTKDSKRLSVHEKMFEKAERLKNKDSPALLMTAAKNGLAKAAVRLAELYEDGSSQYGMPCDSKSSIKFYILAAGLGDESSKKFLNSPERIIFKQLQDPSTIAGWFAKIPENYLAWLNQPLLASIKKNSKEIKLCAIRISLGDLLYAKDNFDNHDLQDSLQLYNVILAQCNEMFNELSNEESIKDAKDILDLLSKLDKKCPNFAKYLKATKSPVPVEAIEKLAVFLPQQPTLDPDSKTPPDFDSSTLRDLDISTLLDLDIPALLDFYKLTSRDPGSSAPIGTPMNFFTRPLDGLVLSDKTGKEIDANIAARAGGSERVTLANFTPEAMGFHRKKGFTDITYEEGKALERIRDKSQLYQNLKADKKLKNEEMLGEIQKAIRRGAGKEAEDDKAEFTEREDSERGTTPSKAMELG